MAGNGQITACFCKKYSYSGAWLRKYVHFSLYNIGYETGSSIKLRSDSDSDTVNLGKIT